MTVHCLVCGYGFDTDTQIDEKGTRPRVAVSICLNCGHIAIYNDDRTTLRHPTAAEARDIMKARSVRIAVEQIKARGLFR